MTICVTLIEKNGRVSSELFQKEEVNIGRSSSNDVKPDPVVYSQVSRRHSRLLKYPNDVYVYEDLDSTQGSWIDGKEIREKRLRLQRGDVITLGRDGPGICVQWPLERITGNEGTHYRFQSKASPGFPLAFSPLFLERYKRYERIAAGGFGEVWRGYPIDGSAPVAIKLMHPQLLDPANLGADDRRSLIARFSREARITYLLGQSGAPSIVRVHTWGDDADRDYLYIIMDYVMGVSFAELLYPRRMLPVDQVCHYMSHVASALDAAHTFEFQDESGNRFRGIVHRDIKPNNLLIERATDTCWVVDFGVAGFQEGGERLTATNISVGTHQFLPLESIEHNQINPATDLWGFTLTLYLGLSGGRFPYPGLERADIIRALRQEVLIPINAVRSDLPQPLVDAITRSLSVDPRQRIQNAGEWARLLRTYAGTYRPSISNDTQAT